MMDFLITKMNFSILILTLNEQQNLSNCLNYLSSCNDIVILDSHSTDKTVEIAEKAGARVFQRIFDNYASQRNYGLNEIEYKYDWVLMVDADEIAPAKLISEINATIDSCDPETTLYRMRRKDYFLGKWIKRSSGYPTWFGRLMRIGHVSVERKINEEYHTDGKIGELNGHLLHYPFNKGFHAWFEKHNRYSSMEAEFYIKKNEDNIKIINISSKDPIIRRKTIKHFVYKLPGRPLLIFFALYIWRLGFLDGRAGFVFCILRAFYEFMIDCKKEEVKLRRANKPL